MKYVVSRWYIELCVFDQKSIFHVRFGLKVNFKVYKLARAKRCFSPKIDILGQIWPKSEFSSVEVCTTENVFSGQVDISRQISMKYVLSRWYIELCVFDPKSTFHLRFGLKVNFQVYKLARPKMCFRTKSTFHVKFWWTVQCLSDTKNCVFCTKRALCFRPKIDLSRQIWPKSEFLSL